MNLAKLLILVIPASLFTSCSGDSNSSSQENSSAVTYKCLSDCYLRTAFITQGTYPFPSSHEEANEICQKEFQAALDSKIALSVSQSGNFSALFNLNSSESLYSVFQKQILNQASTDVATLVDGLTNHLLTSNLKTTKTSTCSDFIPGLDCLNNTKPYLSRIGGGNGFYWTGAPAYDSNGVKSWPNSFFNSCDDFKTSSNSCRNDTVGNNTDPNWGGYAIQSKSTPYPLLCIEATPKAATNLVPPLPKCGGNTCVSGAACTPSIDYGTLQLATSATINGHVSQNICMTSSPAWQNQGNDFFTYYCGCLCQNGSTWGLESGTAEQCDMDCQSQCTSTQAGTLVASCAAFNKNIFNSGCKFLATCPQGYTATQNGCYDFNNDRYNCGSFGHVCPDFYKEACVNGACVNLLP